MARVRNCRVVRARQGHVGGFIRSRPDFPVHRSERSSRKGRAQLITELDEAAREFFVTSQHLRSIQVRLAIRRGVSKHTVIQRIQDLRSGETPKTELGRRAAVLAKGSPQAIETIEEEFTR